MAGTSKELLDQPPKSSPFESLLLSRNDSMPESKKNKKQLSSQNDNGRTLTSEAPKSQVIFMCIGMIQDMFDGEASRLSRRDNLFLQSPQASAKVLGRVKDFLGVMAKANEKLECNAQGSTRTNYDIEVLSGNEQEYIEMDLLLGVAELQTPEAIAAAEAAMGRPQPSAASTTSSSSSSSDTEDESDDDNGIAQTHHSEKQDSKNKKVHDESKSGDKPNKRAKIVVLN